MQIHQPDHKRKRKRNEYHRQRSNRWRRKRIALKTESERQGLKRQRVNLDFGAQNFQKRAGQGKKKKRTIDFSHFTDIFSFPFPPWFRVPKQIERERERRGWKTCLETMRILGNGENRSPYLLFLSLLCSNAKEMGIYGEIQVNMGGSVETTPFTPF